MKKQQLQSVVCLISFFQYFLYFLTIQAALQRVYCKSDESSPESIEMASDKTKAVSLIFYVLAIVISFELTDWHLGLTRNQMISW